MSSDNDDGPPWFPLRSDGSLGDMSAIPDRLLRHPELEQRGLASKLYEPLKAGCVYSTNPEVKPAYAIKILDSSTEEVVIQQRLLRELHRPNNHTLPSEITVTGHPLLIMPTVSRVDYIYPGKNSLSVLLDVMFQIVEGIEFLHSLRIAHLDICGGNMLAAHVDHANAHEQVVANRLYIIDFGQSRQFALRPGVQPAIMLPETQVEPPNDLLHFDPYSWDIYCAGRMMEYFVERRYNVMRKINPPWLATKLIEWLIGIEQGCTGVCRCRPTARTALRVLVVLRWAVLPVNGYDWVVHSLSKLWTTRT